MSDPADYLKFRVDRAFELTISVSDVKSLYNNGSGITIKVLNSSGKVVGNYSVANGSKSFTMSLLAGMGQTFYIEVTSKKSNAIMNYELEVDYKELNANNADDTWTLAQNNAAYHCRVDAVSSEQGNKVSETLVETDWVGFGDTARLPQTGAFAGRQLQLHDLQSGRRERRTGEQRDADHLQG